MRWYATLLCVVFLGTPLLAQRPASKGTWYTDYPTAKAEAQRTGKPMLVLFRCEPCTDFAKFDALVQRSAKPLDEVAEQFIRVRLNRITGVDLSLFDFDYDLSWAVLTLSPDEKIYGRYGGRDATNPLTKLTAPGFTYALQQTLKAHQAGTGTKPDRTKAMKPEDYPAFKARKRNDCVHCHQVNEFRRVDLKKANTWTRDELDAYPPPESIGLTFDVDQGDRIKAVAVGSPAEVAGLKPDDRVLRLQQRTVWSYADAQYALHHAPREGMIPIEWQRGTTKMSGQIAVKASWKRVDRSWRPSQFDLLPTLAFSGADLTATEKEMLKLPAEMAAFRQDKFVHSTLKAVGIQAGDIVVAVNGQPVKGTMDDLANHVRREWIVGDTVTWTIRRGNDVLKVPFVLK